MVLQDFLENINEASLFVCFCSFWWILLVAGRADEILSLPYWAIFGPLWLWKIVAIIGWLFGLAVWLRQRRSWARTELSSYPRFDPVQPYIQALTVSLFFILLIACSEILLCIRLSIPSIQLSYFTILTPLLLVGSLGVFGFLFVMIDSRANLPWSPTRRPNRRRATARSVVIGDSDIYGPSVPATSPLSIPSTITNHPRRICSFTLELCIAANFLQLLFLIARLDNWITSKWVVIFIPSYILLSMGFLFCLIGLIVALIRCLTSFFIPIEQVKLPIYYYASQITIEFLLCTSIVLLALRLDGHLAPEQASYSLVSAPFLIGLVLCGVNALYNGPGNPWWFGLGRNISVAVFEMCPNLQLYANTTVSTSYLWKPPGTDTSSSSLDAAPYSAADPGQYLQHREDTALNVIFNDPMGAAADVSNPQDYLPRAAHVYSPPTTTRHESASIHVKTIPTNLWYESVNSPD